MKYLIGFLSIFLFASSIVQAQILTQWTAFSDCPVTCNVGNQVRTRTRTCTPANLCQGVSLFETTPCNTQYPCPEYRLGDWGTWSACSESCRATQNYPTRVRTRSYCLSNSTSSYQCTPDYMISYEPCNIAACSIVKSCSSINFTFVFVLDSSSSVDALQWQDEKNLVLAFVNSSSFGVNPNVDVAVVNFGKTAKVVADCGTFKSYSTFETFMNNLNLLGGGTAINQGLLAAEIAFQRCQKLNLEPVIILLTDGFENIDNQTPDSNIANENRIKKEALLVAGATKDYKKEEIDRITSYIDNNGQNVSFSYYAPTFTDLLTTLGSTLYSRVVGLTQCETQGQWTTWSAWSSCSQLCGFTGTIQRSRSCINPTSNNFQGDCEIINNIANLDFMTCFQPCTASFSEWSSWAACSASCRLDSGPPTTTRFRTCSSGLGSCIGSLSETQECNTNTPCPGIISSWGSWGLCSASCQLTSVLPTQQRSRVCIGATLGGNCGGLSTVDSQSCNVGIYCPGTISDWSSWGACSDACNNLVSPPSQTRSRSCIGYSTWDPTYLGCPSILRTEQQPCNINIGCSGTYGTWSAWSSCSESCQSNINVSPFQTQTRQCLGATLGGGCSGPSSQTQNCNVQVSCPGILSLWGAWGSCTASCQLSFTSPTQTRNRQCTGATFSGNCNGLVLTEIQNCNEQVYCPGTISDWSSWSVCSASCNNLVTVPSQTRTRSCSGFSTWDPTYTGCPGITRNEQISCNANVGCPGTYNAWNAWSTCSESCQSNANLAPFQTQTRQCIGATLGAGCVGPSSQTQNCNVGVSCPGILGTWAAWGACSASCQLDLIVPQQTSTRTCTGGSLGGNCNGAVLTQTKNCNAEVICPGVLTDWTAWGVCSATCNTQVNGPFQTRDRSCVGFSTWNPNFAGCVGATRNEQQLCNQNVPCPGNYGAWAAWGSCSESCQSNINIAPFQTQTRPCLGATLNGGCPGASSQTQSCNVGVSCPGILSLWGAWGACTASCQLSFTSPTQTRNRQCNGATFNGNCNGLMLTDTQNCNEQVYCPGTISDWSSWSVCSASCNNLVTVPSQTRTRSCSGFSTWDPTYTGCPGITRSEQISCNANVGCPGTYNAWNAWSTCSESCQSNSNLAPFQTQTRQCIGATLGAGCVGPSSQTQNCNVGVSCPGILSTWAAWGACSASCQLDLIVPQQTSTRTCSGGSLGGNCNGAVLTQTKNCNAEVLCPGVLTDWTAWGVCSATCNTQVNGPFQTRDRSCVGFSTWNPNFAGCVGATRNEQQLCNQNVPCPGNYGAWAAWGSCSESCQSNVNIAPFQTQTRSCLGATLNGGCPGASSQTQNCNVGVSCPGILSLWGAWGACTASCQVSFTSPTQTRNRQCNGATFNGNCNGLMLTDTQNCNEQVYCPGTISDWSSWSVCSASCNNLVTVPSQTRTRSCSGFSTWDPTYTGCPGITRSEQISCNANVGCPGTYNAWNAWSTCSESCQSNSNLAPFQTQTRQCIGATLGAGCVGPSSQTQNCNVGVSCPGILSDWAAWGACSASCQLEFVVPQQTSTRTCSGASFGGNCNGAVLTQSKNCNAEVLCPGVLTDWTAWGVCSATCNTQVNGPFQTRDRSCVGFSTWNPNFAGCVGATRNEQQLCNQNVPCPGNYGAWAAWGSCSESCQSNVNIAPFQTQTRSCLGATLNGGCPGASSQTQNCNVGVSCPGILSLWGAWGACTASCQVSFTSPTQTRNRQCNGATFNGNCNGLMLTDTQNCNEQVYCPGTISDWSSWSVCSASCNNLVTVPSQTRTRSCSGFSTWDPTYTGCPGITRSEQISCNANVGCPGTYNAWNAWSTCSESCQSNSNLAPFQTQTRQCIGATLGAGCVGPSSQTQNCNVGVSCPGILSDWAAWGACSASCQLEFVVPQQTSTRTCSGASFGGNCNGAVLTQSKNCNAEVLCPGVLTEWAAWSTCSASCNTLVNGGPIQTRTRTCNGFSTWNPNFMGCVGASRNEQQLCNQLVSCPGFYTGWSAWSTCSESCQSNVNSSPTQFHTRNCVNFTLNGGCVGLSSETQNCNFQVSCPGDLTQWSTWSSCSQSCQISSVVPTMSRNRNCLNPTFGGNCQGQSLSDVMSCNAGVVCPGQLTDWTSWSQCPATCQQAVGQFNMQYRSRQCVNTTTGNCGGASLNDQVVCVRDVPCPGILGQWSTWSTCSESCRSNLLIAPSQTRTRTCTTATLGANCGGASLVESLTCNANVGCPGVWTSWGPFTDCSASCQSTGNIIPTQSRQRFCVNNTLDGPCPSDNNGDKIQTVQCNVGVICPVRGTWGAWGDWSSCSASCDAGLIQRSRACSVPYPIGAGDDCIGNTTQTLPCKLFDCPKSCAIAKRCNCSQVKQWSSVPTFDQFQSRGLTLGGIETVLGYLSSYGDDTVDKACQACNTMMLTTLRSNVADQLTQAKAARAKLELIKNDLRDVIYCNGVILNNPGLWNLYDLLFERATMLDGVIIELNAIYLRFDAALTSCQSYGWIHQTFKTILRKCTF
ncbi:SCO-spondin isoform X2 [Hydra vulgaris]|uniref:SCO-spondin isoform X2 n=1 Tax=Hydra vulgaris TaxID=6087 RepID=UPI0032EA790B